MDSRLVVPLAAAGLATSAILVATLIPVHNLASASHEPRVAGAPFQLADFARNIVLFAPLGASLACNRLSVLRALLLAAALSAGIELAQGALPIAGRDASVSDWVANVAGTGLAIALCRTARTWLRPAPRTVRRLALLAGAAAAACLVGTGVLLTPDPTDAIYFGHHTPSSLAYLAPYDGTVLDASIDEVKIPYGWLPSSERIRNRLRGDYTLRVNALSGAPPTDLAALLLVTDYDNNEILLLGPDGDDLVYRFRTRADSLGLQPATVRLRRALAQIAPGSALELRVERSAADLCIAVDRDRNCGYGFTVGDGWQLFTPDDRIAGIARWPFASAWLALLFLPLGYWGRRDGASLAAGGIAAAALLLAPFVTPLRPTPVSQVASAGCGAALGLAARRRFAALPAHAERGD